MEKTKECRFSQGYACALANLVKDHGHSTEVDDAFRANYMSVETMRERGVDEYDIETLLPVVKEVERKRSRVS